jgi:uncharacterized membrane protein YgcG
MKKFVYLGLLCILTVACRRGAVGEECSPVAKCSFVCPDCSCETCECDEDACWDDCCEDECCEDDCFVIPPEKESYGSLGGYVAPYSVGSSSGSGGYAGGFSGGGYGGGFGGGGWGSGGGGGGGRHIPDHPNPPPPHAVPEPSSIVAWGSVVVAFVGYSIFKRYRLTKRLKKFK